MFRVYWPDGEQFTGRTGDTEFTASIAVLIAQSIGGTVKKVG